MGNNKTTQKSPEHYIQFALKPEIPPLYDSVESSGIIVKFYNFISNHERIRDREILVTKIEQNNYSMLSAYKSELENQLELSHDYCIDQYDAIKNEIRSWLEDKFDRADWPRNSNEVNERKRTLFKCMTHEIYIFVYFLQYGEMIEWRQQEPVYLLSDQLKESKHYSNRKLSKTKPSELEGVFEPAPEFVWHAVHYNISELLKNLSLELKNLERVVARSADLFLEYLNVQVHLYGIDPEEILANHNETEKLIKAFVRKFKPRVYSKQMIEDYLKEWERNKGLSDFRKTTMDELESDYPKLGDISDSVIDNWEKKWKKFRDARTEK